MTESFTIVTICSFTFITKQATFTPPWCEGNTLPYHSILFLVEPRLVLVSTYCPSEASPRYYNSIEHNQSPTNAIQYYLIKCLSTYAHSGLTWQYKHEVSVFLRHVLCSFVFFVFYLWTFLEKTRSPQHLKRIGYINNTTD